MSYIPKSKHKVYIYRDDYNIMCTEVFWHQRDETGGNLFGLWTTSGSAVIHVALGPGQGCRRTDTSFHQNIDYMHRVGRFVNDTHMLCHIGEWHSHHCLSLNRPSQAEERTIQRNFPKGMDKYLVIIANIEDKDTVKLSPYFFTDGGKRYEKAEYEVLDTENPFMNDDKILTEMKSGSNYQGSDSTSPTRLRAVDPGSHKNHRSSSARSSDNRRTPLADHTSFRAGNSPPGGSTSQQQTANSENEKATTKDVSLKEVYDCLRKFFGGEGEVEIESGSHGDIQMTFKHDSYYWMVSFPETYPDEPAKLCREYNRDYLSNSSPCSHYYLEKPLTSHVNILLSVKKWCLSFCETCKTISREALSQPVPATTHSVPITTQSVPATVVTVATENRKLMGMVKELTNEIQMTLPALVKFVSKAQSDGSYKVQFEHFYRKWILDIPPEFPDKPAEVRQQYPFGDRESEKLMIRNPSNNRQEEKPLVSVELIILAIRSNCCCQSCSDYICKNCNS